MRLAGHRAARHRSATRPATADFHVQRGQGAVNDDKSGYHETITQAYAIGVQTFLDGHSKGTLGERINALLSGPADARDWLLRFWSRDVLFSVTARRGWVEPDLAPLLCRACSTELGPPAQTLIGRDNRLQLPFVRPVTPVAIGVITPDEIGVARP